MTAGVALAGSPKRRSGERAPVAMQGVLWGIGASVLDSMVLPVTDRGFATLVELFVWTTPGWCLVGVGIAAWIRIAGERLLHPAFFAASLAGCALVLSGARLLAYAAMGASAPQALFPNGTDALAAFLYQAWFIAFYGGLYLLAWTLDRRGQRTRRLLGQAGIARLRTQALLGEAQIRDMRNHIEPELMLRTMAQIERRYAVDPADADVLLGRLVNFLRAAMPGVRAGKTTLRKEIDLCRSYAELGADLNAGASAWQVAAPAALPAIAFPPLALLSLQMSSARACVNFRGRVAVTLSPDEVVASIGGMPPPPTGWLDAQAIYRLRVALAALHRDRWQLHVAEVPDAIHPFVTIRLAIDDTPHDTRETQ